MIFFDNFAMPDDPDEALTMLMVLWNQIIAEVPTEQLREIYAIAHSELSERGVEV